MIIGRGTATRLLAPTVLAVIGAASLCPSSACAQDGEAAPLDEAPPDAPPEDSTDVTDEGVPDEAVEASEAVTEVEKAMEKVEEEIEEGLPAEFTIEFGDTYDWLRLTSGEWLKGTLKRMREDEMEFDSDKLNLVKFDWEKVDQLHCPQINTYVFEDKVDVVGRAVVTKDKVLVETVDGVKSYPRTDLLSIVDGEPRELNWWSSKLGIGFSANAGNTNQGSLTMSFELARADYRTRSRLRYDGTIYANREENVNRHIGTAEVVLYLSHRWYFTPAGAQLLNDRFQNIFLRTEDPPPRADGTVPESNDYQLIVSVALELG